MTKESKEFENFDRTMRDLMSVPHEQIKAVLDAEKAAKKNNKKRKVKKSFASDHVSDDRG
jgi:hypothetical protein